MIYREHLIEIYVNGEKLELENQRSINLRLNNVLFNPEKVSSSQADYSFSFKLPSTPKNDRILNYANNLSKINKFNVKYDAHVYADGQEIFHGSLVVKGYEGKQYNVNLVQVKMNSIDDIFGDSVMTDIPWYVPFDGATTINQMNADSASTVTFPLVSYGVFQKDPKAQDEVANTYTSKFDIDKYNRWWIESFYPSLNMMETVRQAFEWKGYTVHGDAFTDPILSEIFMSTNLASEQVPVYNLGNPRLGKVQLATTMSTSGNGYEQELQFPYFYVDNVRGHFGSTYTQHQTEAWNWENIRIYDILKSGSTSLNDTYMYDPNEKMIIIPADGFYKIDLQVSSRLTTTGSLTVMQNMITDGGTGNDIEQKNVTITPSFLESTPIEIQLVRNYDDNCELIKGKNNKEYINGNPTQTSYAYGTNIREWQTCFPHEDPYASRRPTKINNLTVSTSSRQRTSGGNFAGSSVGNEGGTTAGGSRSGSGGSSGFGGRGGTSSWANTGTPRNYSTTVYGYVPMDGEIMGFDQAVADNFICGFSSFLGGTGSVMKNGYSWSKSYSEENYAFYNCGYKTGYMGLGDTVGYKKMVNESGTTVYQNSDYGYNSWVNAPVMTLNVNNTSMDGTISCMVWLNKNDRLELFAIQRSYVNTAGTYVNYSTTNTVQLKIEAASPNSMAFLRYQGYNYASPSQFDYDLKVTNFLNEETTVSSFIQGVQKAYNLQISQDGKNVWIDTIKNSPQYNTYAVDIDNRVNTAEALSETIEYPKSMSVQYKIDEDEWGFERSVEPQSMLNQPDWKDYADRGYSIIQLNDDTYVTETSDISLPFSYTWYDNFKWKEVDQSDTESGDYHHLRIPVLSKFTYMIDGYDYDESMKHDGYSLPQRFWFRPVYDTAFVWLDSHPAERIQIYIPVNNNTENINLSYKTTENSLLRYFNTKAYLASNYVEVEAYLNPQEYNDLKNGAMVHFDEDLYLVSEMQGYDPTGANKTKIKMIKKVN